MEPGYLHPHIAQHNIAPPVHIIAFMFPVVNHIKHKLDAIVINIKYFAFVGNTLLEAQLVKKGPNSLWFIIQLCIRSELRAKQKAAPTAGVDQGNPGRYTPIIAITNRTQPKLNHNAFFILIFIQLLLEKSLSM
jgi:hypothetical protein